MDASNIVLWYTIQDTSGNLVAAIDAVPVAQATPLWTLRKQIHHENKPVLGSSLASQLSFTFNQTELKLSESVPVDTSEDNPLVVVAALAGGNSAFSSGFTHTLASLSLNGPSPVATPPPFVTTQPLQQKTLPSSISPSNFSDIIVPMGEPSPSLILRQIPKTLAESELRSLFEKYGTILSCKIVYSRGFINFATLQSAITAQNEMEGFIIDGFPLRVGFTAPEKGSRKSTPDKEILSGPRAELNSRKYLLSVSSTSPLPNGNVPGAHTMPPSPSIHLRQLPKGLRVPDLISIYSKYGEISVCRIVGPNGFVNFDSIESAITAQRETNGLRVDDTILKVNFADPTRAAKGSTTGSNKSPPRPKPTQDTQPSEPVWNSTSLKSKKSLSSLSQGNANNSNNWRSGSEATTRPSASNHRIEEHISSLRSFNARQSPSSNGSSDTTKSVFASDFLAIKLAMKGPFGDKQPTDSATLEEGIDSKVYTSRGYFTFEEYLVAAEEFGFIERSRQGDDGWIVSLIES
ncbi:hypothetical protein HDU79_010738 [Rhizoclosmatium sp. JEL0117]|nr:hypothetical protein HDU79_010738 [Rhizoclosmatium sp. JEL0117]